MSNKLGYVCVDRRVIIANAFYALHADNGILRYEILDQFKTQLYRNLSQKYHYVQIIPDTENCISLLGCYFIRENDGIVCIGTADYNFIKQVNSFYSEDVQNIIAKTREELKEILQNGK